MALRRHVSRFPIFLLSHSRHFPSANAKTNSPDTRTITNGVKGAWVAAEKPPTASAGLQLYLVRQEQKPGLRAHWSLVACDADNNNYVGTVWQVNGDPLTGMTYSEKPVR